MQISKSNFLLQKGKMRFLTHWQGVKSQPRKSFLKAKDNTKTGKKDKNDQISVSLPKPLPAGKGGSSIKQLRGLGRSFHISPAYYQANAMVKYWLKLPNDTPQTWWHCNWAQLQPEDALL